MKQKQGWVGLNLRHRGGLQCGRWWCSTVGHEGNSVELLLSSFQSKMGSLVMGWSLKWLKRTVTVCWV